MGNSVFNQIRDKRSHDKVISAALALFLLFACRKKYLNYFAANNNVTNVCELTQNIEHILTISTVSRIILADFRSMYS